MKGFILSLLAIVSLWACKGTEEPDLEIGEDEAGLTISIASQEILDSRATTTNLTGENAVNNVVVYVYNSITKKLLASTSIESTDFKSGVATKEVGKIPTDLVDVVAIANVDMSTASVSTLDELSAKTITYNPSDFGTNGLPMSAMASGQALVKGEKNTVTLYLERVVAKVNIDWTVAYEEGINVQSYKLLRCYMVNGRNTTTLVANPNLIVSNKLYYGYVGVKKPEADVADEDNFLTGTLVHNSAFDQTANVSANKVSFYVFENNSSNESLGAIENRSFKGSKFVLEYEVEYKNGNKNVTTYVAAINADMDNSSYTSTTGEEGSFIKRNNVYNVHYDIKAMGGEPSDEDPTVWDPVVSRDLIVEINVLDWDLTINQKIQF